MAKILQKMKKNLVQKLMDESGKSIMNEGEFSLIQSDSHIIAAQIITAAFITVCTFSLLYYTQNEMIFST